MFRLNAISLGRDKVIRCSQRIRCTVSAYNANVFNGTWAIQANIKKIKFCASRQLASLSMTCQFSISVLTGVMLLLWHIYNTDTTRSDQSSLILSIIMQFRRPNWWPPHVAILVSSIELTNIWRKLQIAPRSNKFQYIFQFRTIPNL